MLYSQNILVRFTHTLNTSDSIPRRLLYIETVWGNFLFFLLMVVLHINNSVSCLKERISG